MLHRQISGSPSGTDANRLFETWGEHGLHGTEATSLHLQTHSNTLVPLPSTAKAGARNRTLFQGERVRDLTGRRLRGPQSRYHGLPKHPNTPASPVPAL